MPISSPQPYVMAACSTAPLCAFTGGTVDRTIIDRNLAACITLTERASTDHGARLIVFPQFGLTGYAMVPAEAWCEAAFEFPGHECDLLAETARRTGTWIAIQVPERHAAFPGRYFLSCAIIGPDGPVLVHRKSYSLSLRTSPIDVHDRFVEVFGPDAFYPVAQTPLGCMGATIGAELHWPEATRSLALKGTEIIVNPIAAAPHLDYLGRPGALHVRSVRAFENMVYLATANIAAGPDAPVSTIYDYQGAPISQLADKGASVTLATIDLAALRHWREQPSANFLAQLQPSTTVQPDPTRHWPKNAWAERPAQRFEDLVNTENAAWNRVRSAWEYPLPKNPSE